MKQLSQKLTRFLGSRRFFYLIIGFFLFEALWLVFTAIYPMAFDEDFHFGLIQLYSHHWTPFLSGQPVGADRFGAVAHDPSYLYHFVLSFPYRIIAWFTSNETIQVIILRLINVAIFTWGLLLYRKVMLRAKASQMLANVTLAIFVLIPVVPFLAAHINYDNIFMVLLPLLCLTGFTIIEGLQQKRIELKALTIFLILCIISCLVKYPALPVVVAGVLYLVWAFWRTYKGNAQACKVAFHEARARLDSGLKISLLGMLLLFSMLFVQRYGVNLALYHDPVPDCGKILTAQQCSSFGPWARDHGYKQNVSPDFKPNPATFMNSWLHGMWHRLFFAINGSKSYYMNYLELPLPSKSAIVLSVLGIVSMIVGWRPIFRDNALLAFTMTMALGYLLVLWLNGYIDYSKLGRAVAINGRYLLPILPLLAIAMGRGISLTLQKIHLPQLKPYLATVFILCFLYGGGIFTFILRSDASWYWPNQAVLNANDTVRKVLSPITPQGPKQ